MDRPLSEARAGERVIICSINADASRIDKLAALGLLPGAELTVQQTKPAVIVWCDETSLAIEPALAAMVMVVTPASRPGG